MVERIKRKVLEEAREYGNRVGSIENQERIRYEYKYVKVLCREIKKERRNYVMK
jgi:hypothetical protein